MATGRFRSPKTEAEEIALLSETVRKNTKCNTKWTVHDFTTWQNTKMNQKSAVLSLQYIFEIVADCF